MIDTVQAETNQRAHAESQYTCTIQLNDTGRLILCLGLLCHPQVMAQGHKVLTGVNKFKGNTTPAFAPMCQVQLADILQ